MRDIPNAIDPILAIERAAAIAVNIYDQASKYEGVELRTNVLLLLAHLREARKVAQ